MSSIRLVYMSLLLMVTALECQPKESDSESIKIKPSKARGEALGRTLLHLAPNWKVAERLVNEGRNPMDCAKDSGHNEIVELLRKHGAKG